MKNGSIILVDDDADDQDLFQTALTDLKISNTLLCFSRTADAYSFLLNSTEQPFIIFCDINLPEEDGTDFKERLDSNPILRQKSIPFVFFSTSNDRTGIVKAYMQVTIQGYFQKPSGYSKLKSMLKTILQYWEICLYPNS